MENYERLALDKVADLLESIYELDYIATPEARPFIDKVLGGRYGELEAMAKAIESSAEYTGHIRYRQAVAKACNTDCQAYAAGACRFVAKEDCPRFRSAAPTSVNTSLRK